MTNKRIRKKYEKAAQARARSRFIADIVVNYLAPGAPKWEMYQLGKLLLKRDDAFLLRVCEIVQEQRVREMWRHIRILPRVEG